MSHPVHLELNVIINGNLLNLEGRKQVALLSEDYQVLDTEHEVYLYIVGNVTDAEQDVNYGGDSEIEQIYTVNDNKLIVLCDNLIEAISDYSRNQIDIEMREQVLL